MVFISPEAGTPTENAKLLLALAEDVNHVQTTMDGPNGVAFVVPEYLAKLYAEALVHMEAEDAQAGEEEEPAEPEAEESEPAKRKPGRPKNTDKV